MWNRRQMREKMREGSGFHGTVSEVQRWRGLGGMGREDGHMIEEPLIVK